MKYRVLQTPEVEDGYVLKWLKRLQEIDTK